MARRKAFTASPSPFKPETTCVSLRDRKTTKPANKRNYPGLTVPVHLFQSKCSENMQATLDRFPFFNSTTFEQRMLFQRPKRGELAPLTILPTAKYFEAA